MSGSRSDWITMEGSTFSIRFKQIYYPMNAMEPQSSPQPFMAKLEIQLSDRSKLIWIVEPRHMTAAKIQKRFSELIIEPKKEKEFNFQLRTAFSKVMINRPFSLIERTFYDAGLSSDKQTPGLYLYHTGWQRLPNGQMIYVAGDRVIGNCQFDVMINPDISNIHLPLLAEVPPEETTTSLIRQLTQAPTVRLVIWAYTLLTSIQSLILLAGIPLQCILFVYGGQSAGKSTAVRNLFSVYEKTGLPSQLALFFDAGSTMPSLRSVLSLFQDIPVTIDDLCIASDQDTQRKRRKLGGQLIRDCANKIPVSKMNGLSSSESCVSAGVTITSEFCMEAASELTRTIPVHITHHGATMSHDIRKYSSSTLLYFLNWIAPQADHLLKQLNSDYTQSTEAIEKESQPRILTSKFALDWTFHLFCRFCEESAYLDESNSISLYQSYCDAINQQVQCLLKDVEKVEKTVKKANIPWYIVQGIKSGELTLCDKKKKLRKQSGYQHKGKLYLWPHVVYQYITQQNGYLSYTKNKISKELKLDGVLIQEYDDATDNTVHLEVQDQRLRFLCLNELSLYQAAKEY